MSQTSVVSSSQNSMTGKLRRSTRVQKTVPLIVLGQNQGGETFMERTLCLSLNKHGCRYSSRHDYVVGTWVTLQIVDLNIPDHKPTTVRAVVRSVHPPESSRELHQVGVELEIPANVWGIVTPPTDWTCGGETSTLTAQLATVIAPTYDSATKRAGTDVKPEPVVMTPTPVVTKVATLPSPPAASSEPLSSNGAEAPRPKRVVVTAEGLISALQGKLAREAEKAVQAAASKHLSDLIGNAIHAIEEARQASTREVQEFASKQIEKINAPVKEECVRAMAAQWKADMEGYRSRTEEIAQRFEKQACELSRKLANAQESSEAAREITPQIPARLKEAVTQATSDFEYSAALIVDRRYERLLESVHAVTQEAFLTLNARSAEVQALAQSVVNTALEGFRRETELHANMALSEAKERVVSTLSSLNAENRASWDKQRQGLEAEVARSAERATEQFRTGMKAFMYSCLVAAVGAVDEHSKATLNGLKDEGRALNDAPSESPIHDEGWRR